MKIGFQVEGSSNIGMGHIMRCLALASEFSKSGHRLSFFSNHPRGRAKLIQFGYKVSAASGVQERLQIDDIANFIKFEGLDCLIIDSYQVDYDYLFAVKKLVNLLCYIDDRNQFVYPADLLINGNFKAEQIVYSKFYPEELFLLGIDYLLMREEFQKRQLANIRPQVERILITMGASDPVNFTPSLISKIRQEPTLDNLKLDIIVGDSNLYLHDLIKLSKNFPEIYIHYNVLQMAELMSQADIAFSAGGGTLYELLACGIPTIAIIIAKNQEYIVEQLSISGYIYNLGWYDSLDFSVLPRIIMDLNLQKRQKLSYSGQILIDGQGTMRVKNAIEKLLIKKAFKVDKGLENF